jgi:hypothetical protein
MGKKEKNAAPLGIKKLLVLRCYSESYKGQTKAEKFGPR